MANLRGGRGQPPSLAGPHHKEQVATIAWQAKTGRCGESNGKGRGARERDLCHRLCPGAGRQDVQGAPLRDDVPTAEGPAEAANMALPESPDECVPSVHAAEEGDKKLLCGRASQPGIRKDACQPLPAAWHGDLRGLQEEQEGDTVLLCHGAPWRESKETGTEEGSAGAVEASRP